MLVRAATGAVRRCLCGRDERRCSSHLDLVPLFGRRDDAPRGIRCNLQQRFPSRTETLRLVQRTRRTVRLPRDWQECKAAVEARKANGRTATNGGTTVVAMSGGTTPCPSTCSRGAEAPNREARNCAANLRTLAMAMLYRFPSFGSKLDPR